MDEDPKCDCTEGAWGGENFEVTDLGMDAHFGDVSVFRCRRCRRLWLHYHYENEAFTASGRWYHGLIAPEMENSVTVDTAHDILEKLDEYWCGGSYFGGRVFKRRGKLDLFP
jgi:hypothetical protein